VQRVKSRRETAQGVKAGKKPVPPSLTPLGGYTLCRTSGMSVGGFPVAPDRAEQGGTRRYRTERGADGNRTHDPQIAGLVLSQLSYSPRRTERGGFS
jgi:hypothetical protein